MQNLGSDLGKVCKMPSSGKFRDLEWPQNSVIRDKVWQDIMCIKCWCVWHDGILLFWLFILNLQLSILNFKFSILHSPPSYIKYPLSNLNSPSSTLLPPSSVKSVEYLTQNALKIAGYPCSFFQVCLRYALQHSIFFSLGEQCNNQDSKMKAIPKMRTNKNNTKLKNEDELNTRLPPATPDHLQHLTAHLIQNGRRGQSLSYWTLWLTFAK